MVSKDDFRRAMSKFATGVTVVTTLDHQGQVHGVTANALTSVCLDPPVLLLCLAHSTNTYGFIETRLWFGLNIMGSSQQDIAQYFAKPPDDRHGGVEYGVSNSASGVPIMDGSMVSFVCHVVGSHVYGDHTIYVAQVEEMKMGDSADPLLFYDSQWSFSIKSHT